MAQLTAPHLDLSRLPPELQDRFAIQAELGARSLREFVRLGWTQLEPGREYQHNWHIDAICEHLEAVTAGEIIRLLINIPPRCMKSLLCSAFWPVWVWINQPNHRWLTASYAQDLATRDAVKSRRMIESAWFQARWGNRFQLIGDQNAKTRYENDHTGYRLAVGVDALATGEGGDTQVIDDPHNVKQAESDVVREGTVRWASETMSTRFMDPKLPRRVIIMQRVHAHDVSGAMLEQGGYTHLCLPMRFERQRMHMLMADKTVNPEYVPPTVLGFEDPRVEENELLWPSRFAPEETKDLEMRLGPYAWAGQFQQSPTPRGGGMIKRDMLKVINPEDIPFNAKLRKVRSWDYAATDPTKQISYTDPDWTVGVLMAIDDNTQPDPDVYILDVIRFREDPGPRDQIVDSTMVADGRATTVWIEQEPGSSGKTIIFEARKRNPGYAVNPPRIDPMPVVADVKKKRRREAGTLSGNKVQRAETFATAAHRGKVSIVRGEWTPTYIAEITTFPLSAKKDQMDATSQAYIRLTERPPGVAEAMAQSGYYSR